MRALEVFGFKHYLSGPSDHPVDPPDGTSESMLLSGISRNIFIWVLVRDVPCSQDSVTVKSQDSTSFLVAMVTVS